MNGSYSNSQGNIMHNQDGNWQENSDGSWSQAIPLPFHGLKKECTACNSSFWKEANYHKHYVAAHTDGKKYRRTVKGLEQL